MPTTLDTIDFSFSTDFIESMDNDKFKLCEIKIENGGTMKSYFLKQKRHGLEKLNINEHTRKVNVKISSKILGTNYPLGICFATLDQLIYDLNQSGITLNKDFINDVTVSFVDVKNDLKFNRKTENYLNSLNHLIAPKFAKTFYPSGITFNENIKSTPIRQSYYDKEYEMELNKDFYKSYPALIGAFDGILRIESRFATKATIRKYFKSCNLLDILSSKNVNYSILNKIIDNQVFDRIIDIENMTISEEKNLGQIYLLYIQYNGDFDKIANHIKSKLSNNTKATYQINNAKIFFAMIVNSKDSLIEDNIEEIKKDLLEQI